MSDLGKLEKQLEKQRQEKADLEARRDQLEEERAALEDEATKGLAGLALDKLMGAARTQAERKLEAEGLKIAAEELTRRIGEQDEVIAETERQIAAAKLQELNGDILARLDTLAGALPELLEQAEALGAIGDKYFQLKARLNGSQFAGNAHRRILQGIEQEIAGFAQRIETVREKASEHYFNT